MIKLPFYDKEYSELQRQSKNMYVIFLLSALVYMGSALSIGVGWYSGPIVMFSLFLSKVVTFAFFAISTYFDALLVLKDHRELTEHFECTPKLFWLTCTHLVSLFTLLFALVLITAVSAAGIPMIPTWLGIIAFTCLALDLILPIAYRKQVRNIEESLEG